MLTIYKNPPVALRIRVKDDDVFVSVVKCVKSKIFPLFHTRNVRKPNGFSIISTNNTVVKSSDFSTVHFLVRKNCVKNAFFALQTIFLDKSGRNAGLSASARLSGKAQTLLNCWSVGRLAPLFRSRAPRAGAC